MRLDVPTFFADARARGATLLWNLDTLLDRSPALDTVPPMPKNEAPAQPTSSKVTFHAKCDMVHGEGDRWSSRLHIPNKAMLTIISDEPLAKGETYKVRLTHAPDVEPDEAEDPSTTDGADGFSPGGYS